MWWGSYYMPGNTAISAGIAPVFGTDGFGLDAYPGAEIMLTKLRPGDLFAIDIGAGARGITGVWNTTAFPAHGYFIFGGGPFVSAHFGFRGFGLPPAEYVGRLDLFSSIGIAFTKYALTGDWTSSIEPSGGLGLTTISGFNYFLTEHIAVTVAGSYQSRYGGGLVGVVYKLGPKEPIAERPEISTDTPGSGGLTGDIAYLTFSTLYWSILGFGGFIADDRSFDEGDGAVWRMSYPENDGSSEITYTRSLLRILSDGSRWWRVEFEADGERNEFEYLVNKAGALRRLRYYDVVQESVGVDEPDDPYAWWGGYQQTVRTRADLEAMSEGSQRIRVRAGTFYTQIVTAEEPPHSYTWWYTSEVPGLLVKMEGREDGSLVVEGALIDVLSGVESPWGPPWEN